MNGTILFRVKTGSISARRFSTVENVQRTSPKNISNILVNTKEQLLLRPAAADVSISNLVCTQLGIRNFLLLPSMIDFVKTGGIFSSTELTNYALRHDNKKNHRLMQVIRFGDDQLYLNDGHHRIIAMILGGRNQLKKEEYCILDTTYEFASTPQFPHSFYTPYDPRIEMRLPNLENFKDTVSKFLNEGKLDKALEFIYQNRHMYVSKRILRSPYELVQHLKPQIDINALNSN